MLGTKTISRWWHGRKSKQAEHVRRREIIAQYAEALNKKLTARRGEWDREDAELRQLAGMASGSGDWGQMMRRLGLRGPLDNLPNNLPSAEQMKNPEGRKLSARFDSAITTDDNVMHWAMADGLAADAAANPMIRYTLRNRARYEIANNCYAMGVGETIANDFCGTGPRLHIDDERLSDDERADIERKFAAWSAAINLSGKLKTMRKAKRSDGEAFACKITNPNLNHAIKLDLRVIEADQVRFVDISLLLSPSVDGIRFDEYGNPVSYHVLRIHPGYWSYATGYVGMPWEYDVWDAKQVIHWFRQDRPGQHRGLPEVLPALPLYATLRRYTQATLDAAETAADFAVLLETEASAGFVDANNNEVSPTMAAPFSSIQLDRRMITTLPQGYHASQMQPQHPQQQYAAFKQEICAEIGRAECVTKNVVLGDSSISNMASGTLDHKLYFRPRQIERDEIQRLLLDNLLADFVAEGVRIREGNGDMGQPYLPQSLRDIGPTLEHSWYWDSNELGDPLKLAAANSTALKDGAKTLAEIYEGKGANWQRAFKSQSRILGVTVPELQELVRNSIFASAGTEPLDAGADGGGEAGSGNTNSPADKDKPAVAPQQKPANKGSTVKRPGQAAMQRAMR